MPEKVMLFFFCSRKTHYFIIYGHILLFMGMSRVGYWETYGRARPQHFQRDSKHILQKTEFIEANEILNQREHSSIDSDYNYLLIPCHTPSLVFPWVVEAPETISSVTFQVDLTTLSDTQRRYFIHQSGIYH